MNLTELSVATWLPSVRGGRVWSAYALFADECAILVLGLLQMTTARRLWPPQPGVGEITDVDSGMTLAALPPTATNSLEGRKSSAPS